MPRVNTIAGLTTVAAILCLVLSSAPIVCAKPLRVGYFKVAPHAMPAPQDKPVGIAVEYFKLIAREMQLAEIDFILLPLNRLLIELENNRIDMALLLAKNDERAAKFVYPAQAFCVTKPSIAVRASSPLHKVTSIEDLLPLSFHETPKNYRAHTMRDERLQIEPLAGNNFTRRCYSMILAGRIDACYQPDHYPIQFEAAREEFASRIRILYLPDAPIGLYSTFSKAGAERYLKAYEAALRVVKQQQSYGAIFEKFIVNFKQP
jgi:polar amino acid transport system substrate-binding protein